MRTICNAGLVVLLFLASITRADSIAALVQVDETSGGIVVTVNGSANSPRVENLVSTAESVSFDFVSTYSAVVGDAGVYYRDLLDPVTNDYSDRAVITIPRSGNIFHIDFASAPATITLPVGAVHFADVAEDGTFQPLFSYAAGNVPPDVYEFRSELAAPLPSTAWAALAIICGLGFLNWRRVWLAIAYRIAC